VFPARPHIVTVEAQASDNVGVTSVAFFLDDVEVAQVETPPYVHAWAVGPLQAGVRRWRAVARDAAGNGAPTPEVSVTVDGDAPVLVDGFMTINGGAEQTGNLLVTVSLRAEDHASQVTRLCLKSHDPTPPPDDDACWLDVRHPDLGLLPSPVLDAPAIPWMLPGGLGQHSVFAWAMDQVGNMSTLGGVGGVLGRDRADILRVEDAVPVVGWVEATSTDTPGEPPNRSDRTVDEGRPLYVRWNVSEPTPDAVIRVTWSPDDRAWRVLADNLPNLWEGNCTAFGWETGCAVVTAPSAGYFRVRVEAVGASGHVGALASHPLNSHPFYVLAGDTDQGTGVSAHHRRFPAYPYHDVRTPDQGRLAVTPGGDVYVLDPFRGLLRVRRDTGVVELVIPITGELGEDSLVKPLRMALDYENGLVFLDQDRVRRLDLAADPPRLENLAGGGTSVEETTPADALKILACTGQKQTYEELPFFAVPGGDVYFVADCVVGRTVADTPIRVLHTAERTVTTLHLSGTGLSGAPDQDITPCRFRGLAPLVPTVPEGVLRLAARLDSATSCPASGVAVLDSRGGSTGPHPTTPSGFLNSFPVGGRDGSLWLLNRFYPGLRRLDPQSHVIVPVAGRGTSVRGRCPDHTPANECAMDPADLVVDAWGNPFFMDAGVIRTVDANGVVVTLWGGDSFSEHARATRFPSLVNVRAWWEGEARRLVILDRLTSRIFAVNEDGTLRHLAGNGTVETPDTVNPATEQPLRVNIGFSRGPYTSRMEINPNNGDVFFPRYVSRLAVLSRDSGVWTDIVGSDGGDSYWNSSADGKAGAEIDLDPYNDGPAIVGWANNGLLVSLQFRGGQSGYPDKHVMLKSYASNDAWRQSHLAGLAEGEAGGLAADDSDAARSPAPYLATGTHDLSGDRWLLLNQANRNVVRTVNSAGKIGTLATLPRSVSGAMAWDPSRRVIYYYDGTNKLYVYDVDSPSETPLPLPLDGMQVVGQSMVVDANQSSVIFTYRQDGFSGVAEYFYR
jgi:hypothetical protein